VIATIADRSALQQIIYVDLPGTVRRIGDCC